LPIHERRIGDNGLIGFATGYSAAVSSIRSRPAAGRCILPEIGTYWIHEYAQDT
jgi:hypothetical protein